MMYYLVLFLFYALTRPSFTISLIASILISTAFFAI